jgi:hypothetical protein
MPLTAIDDFAPQAETAEEPLRGVFAELARLVDAANGLWCADAERFLLSCDALKPGDD